MDRRSRCEVALSLLCFATIVAGAWGGEWATWGRRSPYSSPWTFYVPMLLLLARVSLPRLMRWEHVARERLEAYRDPIGYIRRQMLSAPPAESGQYRRDDGE